MSDTPWTKGPWDVYPLDLGGGRHWFVKVGPHEVIDIHEDDNGEANTRLIAAAPELAEALEKLIEYEPARAEIRPDAKGDRQHAEAVAVFAAARAALAKARGETP